MAGSAAGNFDFNDSGRKANTLGSDQGGNLKGKPGQQAFGGIPGHLQVHPGGRESLQTNMAAHNLSASNQNTLASGQQQIPMMELQPPKRARPTDPKGMLEWDIEQERIKIQQMEARYRQELERLRKDHQCCAEELEKKHQL